MQKLFSRLVVWIFLVPSFLTSAVAYVFFPRWLRQLFFRNTRWILSFRNEYITPIKLSSPKHMNLPETMNLAYADKVTPNQFEHLIAELLKNRGYHHVQVTPASGDFGVDIVARWKRKQYAVQVKQYSGKVPFEAVQQAVAGCPYYKCQAAMVVTNSYFTDRAKQYARKVACELVDRDGLKVWLAEYHLSESPGFLNQLRLQFSRHKLLFTAIGGIILLIALFIVFSEPLCKVLC